MNRRILAWSTGLVCAVTLLAGCSATGTNDTDDTNGASDAGGGGNDGGNDGGQGDDGNDADGTEEPVSPLEPYLGYEPRALYAGPIISGHQVALGGDRELSDEALATELAVEEAIERCMRDQGFEYIPDPVSGSEGARFDEAYALPPEEFAEQYGYGVSTMEGSGDDESDDDSDPNAAIRDALSESAREAYDTALHGELDGNALREGDIEFEGDEPTVLGEPGCQAEAWDEAYQDTEGDSDQAEVQQEAQQQFEGLGQDLPALYERIRTDPRLDQPLQDWATCLADAGHPGFTELSAPSESIWDEYDSLVDQHAGSGESEDAGPHDQPRQPLPPEVVSELAERERSLAVADLACRTEHWLDAYAEVADDLERQFIDDHGEELEQYRDYRAEHDLGNYTLGGQG